LLSDAAIREALTRGRFRLRYAFLPDADGQWQHQPDPVDASESAGAEQFERALASSRIGLTLGPLLKPLRTSERVARRSRFAETKSIVDLRPQGRTWRLAPGESAVAFSTEWLAVAHDLAGLIVSRVSTYNAGLVVTASFVDNNWQGLIKLHLSNHSGRTLHLQQGDEVARLFLFNTADASTRDDARFESHYGTHWPGILEDRADPFPVGPHRRGRSAGDLARNANAFFTQYAGTTLLMVAFVTVGAGSQLYLSARNALDQKSRIDTLEAQVPHAGLATVAMPAGNTQGTLDVSLPFTADKAQDIAAVAELATPTDGASAHARVVRKRGDLVLVLSVRFAAPKSANTNTGVQWVVARADR
jgi:deoxycytidine triphosphate deaminase